ncbi:MAG: DUF3034 family protein [Thermoguttaceae bacterium]
MKSVSILVGFIGIVFLSTIAVADDTKGPPLPFHTIEGVGGGAITPMAYLVNPAPEGALFGKPAAAITYVGLGTKNLDALTVTENVGGMIEFGFAADRFGLGTFPGAIQDATACNIHRSDVWLYNFNVRCLCVKENRNDIPWMPAITVGVHFKINEGIDSINNCLSGGLENIGYARKNGTDFTVTATKTLPKAFFGKPLILTGGCRESQGANLGLLGFSNSYKPTFEGSVAILPFDRWLFAYEFRQKTDPYSLALAPLIGDEDNWHAFDAAFIINKHATLVAGAGIFGTLANTEADNAWWLQLKYEF